MSKKEETQEEVQPVSTKIASAVLLLEEKLFREYDLSLEELRASTITIKNGEVTVKGKK
ncbi:hypothetical protein [Caudoviricetes sp.]|nr:hypothetical protein [Caudoviricetes sp.]